MDPLLVFFLFALLQGLKRMRVNGMTNGDWLRSMTMDDLSDFLYKITDCCCELGQADLCISCERVGCPLYYDKTRLRGGCGKESIRQWLDKEFVQTS